MKFILLIIAFLFSIQSFAQVDTTAALPDSNTVIVHKDARLDQLVKKQATINEVSTREGRKTDKGFRLMIISTNNREEALAAKTKVYTYFRELKAYLWYQSPYFRVKAGNFKDRKDAEAYQKRMSTYFPKGVFVIPDIIEVKSDKGLDDEDDDIDP
ncbi:MAG: SPOR domain-containing protein [Chitinophagaceae bacterium]|nr:SPOR domain-containing protein [Chitinophagaceae bacterium]